MSVLFCFVLSHHFRLVYSVVERFDESIVALQLLLGLEPSDILYFSSRDPHQNPYERQPVKRKQNTFRCQLVWDWQSILMTPPIQHHLQSAEWFAKNYGDYLLYHASNQSLDRTIMKIGLDTFAKALKDFRQLLQLAQEQCQPIFPCSSSGFDQYEASQKNCYADDVGCGYPCLDDLKYDNLLDE